MWGTVANLVIHLFTAINIAVSAPIPSAPPAMSRPVEVAPMVVSAAEIIEP